MIVFPCSVMMSRNLTGSKRIIHDCCIDIYNSVQKWRSLLSESHSTIVNIWMVKQEMNNTDVMDDSHLIADYPPKIYGKLESLIYALYGKLESLETVIRKIQRTVTQINAVSELSDLQQSSSSSFSTVCDQILFKTWHLSNFRSVAHEIATMLEKEYEVKSSICKEICNVTEKSKYLFFEACWKYGTINNSRLNMLLDGLICELGLFSELN